MIRHTAILGVGQVSPKSGKCKHFNIYDVWQNSTVEIWKNEKGDLKFVCTAGTSSLNPGDRQEFFQDQTRAYIGEWTFIEALSMAKFRDSGWPRSSMFTYK